MIEPPERAEACPACGADLTWLYDRPEFPSTTYRCEGEHNWVIQDWMDGSVSVL